jgi:hypothetical protein
VCLYLLQLAERAWGSSARRNRARTDCRPHGRARRARSALRCIVCRGDGAATRKHCGASQRRWWGPVEGQCRYSTPAIAGVLVLFESRSPLHARPLDINPNCKARGRRRAGREIARCVCALWLRTPTRRRCCPVPQRQQCQCPRRSPRALSVPGRESIYATIECTAHPCLSPNRPPRRLAKGTAAAGSTGGRLSGLNSCALPLPPAPCLPSFYARVPASGA